MKVVKLVSSLLDSNTYILEKDNEILIIDSGCQTEKVKKVVGDKRVRGILLTHGHYDHSAFCNDYAKVFGCKIYANKKIKNTLTDKVAIYSEDYVVIDDFSCFEFIDGDKQFRLGEFDVKAFEFKGHSPCCQGYFIENLFFSGDFLFAKSFGRVDLKNGNKKDMLNSFDKIENIDFVVMYSGHGEESLRQEVIKNLSLYRRFLTR